MCKSFMQFESVSLIGCHLWVIQPVIDRNTSESPLGKEMSIINLKILYVYTWSVVAILIFHVFSYAY